MPKARKPRVLVVDEVVSALLEFDDGAVPQDELDRRHAAMLADAMANGKGLIGLMVVRIPRDGPEVCADCSGTPQCRIAAAAALLEAAALLLEPTESARDTLFATKRMLHRMMGLGAETLDYQGPRDGDERLN